MNRMFRTSEVRKARLKTEEKERYRGKAVLADGSDFVDKRELTIVGEDFSGYELGILIGTRPTLFVQKMHVDVLPQTASGIPILA